MFGVLVSGRLAQTDCQQIGETKFMFNIPDADNINHIVVFMTGLTPFPQDLGGAVHFSWPNADQTSWVLLGHITNNKPSAIFKITNLKGSANSEKHPFGTLGSSCAQIGISVEPLQQLAQQTPDSTSIAKTIKSFTDFSQKMLENFVNFATSFAVTQSQMVPNPSETYVPLSTLQKWFDKFKGRLDKDPYFWQH